MPYIDPHARARIDDNLPPVGSPGELAYAIARMAENLLLVRANGFESVRYEDLALVHGVLSGAADEFYRRVMVPYETRKALDNGDVYLFPAWHAEQTADTVARLDALEVEWPEEDWRVYGGEG